MITTNERPAPSPLPGIHHATLAGGAQGLRQISVWEQWLAAGATTPPHRHDCEEVVLCTAGRGRLVVDGRDAQEFVAGQTVCIPRNALHRLDNAGDGELRLLAIFGSSPVVPHFPDGTPIPLPWAT